MLNLQNLIIPLRLLYRWPMIFLTDKTNVPVLKLEYCLEDQILKFTDGNLG